jgi:isopentenyl diphosphate isomerase/L-lactate dehydrogenase-like FMN-dependent dehydrogenase
MEMKEMLRLARERFKGVCRVCPVCNGRACAGEMPGMGGIGTGSSFMANFDSLARIKLNLRTIHAASDPDIAYDFFGQRLQMPILVAPLAGMAMNMGNAMDEKEYLSAMVAGGKEAGSLTFTCDGPNPMFFDLGLEVLGKNQGWGVPTIKPRQQEAFLSLVKRAEDCGVVAIASDIDAAGIIHMRRAGQPAGPWPVKVWEKTIGQTKLPVILKGIMTIQDAKLAVQAGAAGIVVSNHGGRVLDHTPGTAAVLPEIASAVKGRIKIFVDGGVRSGTDVLKMLALGAEAVLVGRPMAVIAVGGGQEGVSSLLKQYSEQLRTAMLYSGSGSLAEITPSILRGEGR